MVETAGLRLKAYDAKLFQKDIDDSSKSVKRFGTTTVEVQNRLAKGDATFAAITNRTAALRTGILRTRVALNEFGATIDAELADAETEFEKAFNAQRLAEFADELSRVGTVMLATGAAAGALIVATGLQASRIEELGVLLEVTRQNAIYMAEEQGNLATAATFSTEAVQEQVQGIRDLHLSGEVANKTVAELIRYNLDWTRATELARLAQDAATFAMQDSSEAVSGLVHGIATLQPRVLRTYGLMINLNEAYKRFAKENNIVAKQLTIAQRQQAAFNEVLRLAPSISGAYEAAMTTASKQVRSLKTDIVNLSEAFGEEYTPALGGAVSILRDFIHALTDISDPWQAFIANSTIAGTTMTIFGGALLKVVPQIVLAVTELQNLSGAALTAQLATAGLTGALLLGIPILIGTAAAIKRAEEVRREEAAGLVLSTDSYGEYEAALRRTELANYDITEALYESVKAYEEAHDAVQAQIYAEELLARVRATRTEVSIWNGIGAIKVYAAELEKQLPYLTDTELALYANEEAMYQLLTAQGVMPTQAREIAAALAAVARMEQFVSETTEALINEVKDWDYNARLAAEKTELLVGANRRLDVSLAAVNWSKSRREIAETIEATEELTEALEKQEKAYTKFDRQAAEATLDAQEKAAEARIKAEDDKNEALEDQAKKHADKMEDIYEDLAQVEIDLQKEIVEAEREAAQERLELQRELARDLEDAERELAQDLADLARDRQEALADAQRDYNRDRADALRDLNRDLADLEKDLAKEVEEIRADHLANLLEIEQDYAQQREDLLADFAQRAADIEAKYSLEPEEPDFDDLREALLEEYRKIYEDDRITSMERQRLMQILAELEKIKAEELAQLEEEKDAQLAILDEQLEEEKTAQEAAYQEELAAAQAAYEERRDERRQQYAEKLEDLKLSLEEEKAEIDRDYARRQEDLRRKHVEERAEILRRHAEALADLDTQLAEEKAKLDAAAAEDRARLAQKLQDEKDNNAEREQELIDDYNKRLGIIAAEEQKEIAEIERNNAIKKQDWIDAYDAIYDSTKTGLENVLLNAVRPGLQSIVDEHRAKIQEILDAWNNSGLPGQSPSPFFRDMAKSWAEGIKAGFDDTAFQANVNSVIGDLQTQIQTALPPQQASLPMGIGRGNVTTTNTTNLTVNPNYQQYQSEASLRDDLSLIMGTVRAWNR